MDRCPECGSMRYVQIGPDNGYGPGYQCQNCGCESDSIRVETEDAHRRMKYRDEKRNRKKMNRR
jgi:DNA replicative helicase MCM subunit Mcm2 (Cdc46/Mcm family)